MRSIKTYRDVTVWQKAMILVNKIFIASANFPNSDHNILSLQVQKSAISIPSSIAKGYGLRSIRANIRCLKLANGFLYELQTQLEIALNQNFINKEYFDLIYEDCRELEQFLSDSIESSN